MEIWDLCTSASFVHSKKSGNIWSAEFARLNCSKLISKILDGIIPDS